MNDLSAKTEAVSINGNRFTPVVGTRAQGSNERACGQNESLATLRQTEAANATGNQLQPVAETAAATEAPASQNASATPGTSPEAITCDVVIVGCGVAGLYCALNLPRQLSVVMLAKTTVDECDSMLAQGGICVQHDANDYAPFFEDTLRAGHFENRCESVDLMIRASRSVIDSLIGYGVQFERDEAGQLRYTREGAHSRARICFHDDTTGAEITTKLLAAVRKLGNVRILEYTRMSDILTSENGADGQCCSGIAAFDAAGRALRINAQATVWACGGIGYYNGYSYTCSATCYTYQCKATMATKSNEAMYIRGQIIYNRDDGSTGTGYVKKNGKGFITTDNLENASSFQSMNATFKVGGHLIETIFVSA